jgi:hypothetical protein
MAFKESVITKTCVVCWCTLVVLTPEQIGAGESKATEVKASKRRLTNCDVTDL